MKLAFNGQAHYTDFDDAYALYVKRAKYGNVLDEATYRKVIKKYCGMLADELEEKGIIDLPNNLGSISAAVLTRKPQYRGDKFIGYGKMDWEKGHYDGTLKTFGLVLLPKHNKVRNIRCFGFVANRKLFKRLKEKYEGYDRSWEPIQFKEEMV